MSSRFRWGAASDVGRLRSANEDALAASDGVFVVADGMGGHLAGEVAAAMAVEILQRSLDPSSAPRSGLYPIDAVVAAVEDANLRIFHASHTRVDQHGMGTTLVALALVDADDETRLGLVNVGDSRAYAIRNGRLRQISVDHSYVQELIASGQITASEARSHPHRNIVTRALGIEPIVHIDAWTLPLTAGDRFILCSDGLVDEVLDSTILEIAGSLPDPQEAADRLVAAANRAGGRDNITVVVVDVVAGIAPITEEVQLAADGRWGGRGTRWADDRSGDVTPTGTVRDRSTAELHIVPSNAADDDITGVITRPNSTDAQSDAAAPALGTADQKATEPRTAATDIGTRDVGSASGGDQRPEPDSTSAQLRPTDPALDATPVAGMPRPTGAAVAGPGDGAPTRRGSGQRQASVTNASGTDARPRSLIHRMLGGLNLATIGFLTAIAAVLVVAFVLIAAYARSGYFVDYDGDRVVVYKGRSGGLLWFDPTVTAISPHTRTNLGPEVSSSIVNRPTFDDPNAALAYVDRLALASTIDDPSASTTVALGESPTTVSATTTSAAASTPPPGTTGIPPAPALTTAASTP